MRIVARLCLLLLIATGAASTAHAATPPPAVKSFADIYRDVKPAVVLIVSAQQTGAAVGTGFIFRTTSTSSDVITANHVIEGATSIDVILDSNLKERYAATVLARDHIKDVAVLRIAVGNRKGLGLLDPSKIEEGMSIAVVGYPWATVKAFEELEGDALRPTVHSGIISAIRLNGEIIQFDAITDHGNSGGPVIDMASGKVVAIVRGFPLDPTYASRGLEEPLPGSFFGPSSSTIKTVVLQSQTTTVSSINSTNVFAGAPQSNSTNSASFRVGYVNYMYQDQISQEVDQTVDARLSSDFQSDNSFYLVPVTLTSIDSATSEQLLGFCQDSRLNAVMIPLTRWALTGGPLYNAYGTLTGYNGYATVVVDLYVTDCAGEPFYIGEKRKSENRYFAHRTPDREVMDMANDLTDQLESDFVAFKSSHQGEWDTLLKYGLAIDPNDGHFHALFYPILKNGQWRVFGVFPGGPADKAGLKPDDVILSINGIDASGLTSNQLFSMLNADSYSLTVERPGGNVTLTVHPEQYQQLVRELAH